jgi:hypothetical protein
MKDEESCATLLELAFLWARLARQIERPHALWTPDRKRP